MPAYGRFTSDFGPRSTGIPGASTYHRGVDIAPPKPGQKGVPVYAVGSGVVATRSYNSGRGNFVKIRHGDGSHTQSQHLESFSVVFGQHVEQGQRIGIMGRTGISSGEHLHFETYNPGANSASSANACDPEPFMRARGVNVRTGAILTASGWVIGGTVPSVPVTPTPVPPQEVDDMFEEADRQRLARVESAAVAAMEAARSSAVSAAAAEQLAGAAVRLSTALATAVRAGDEAVVQRLATQILDVRLRMPRITTARYDTPTADTYADMAQHAVELGLTYADLVTPARAAGGDIDTTAIAAAANAGARAGVTASLPAGGTFTLGGA